MPMSATNRERENRAILCHLVRYFAKSVILVFTMPTTVPDNMLTYLTDLLYSAPYLIFLQIFKLLAQAVILLDTFLVIFTRHLG